MSEYNKLRIEWDCRRGMLELDNVIMPFYKTYFDTLDGSQKQAFLRLLACTDLQLFSWFFNKVTPPDEDIAQIIDLIQKKLSLGV